MALNNHLLSNAKQFSIPRPWSTDLKTKNLASRSQDQDPFNQDQTSCGAWWRIGKVDAFRPGSTPALASTQRPWASPSLAAARSASMCKLLLVMGEKELYT